MAEAIVGASAAGHVSTQPYRPRSYSLQVDLRFPGSDGWRCSRTGFWPSASPKRKPWRHEKRLYFALASALRDSVSTRR